MTDNTDAGDFITGESDPADFGAEQVVAHLAKSDASERDRVLELEDADNGGKGRVTVMGAPVPPSPTAPSLETLAALNETPTETEPEPEDPDALKPGDELPVDLQPFQGEEPHDDGYTRVVVSTDGLPTEVSERMESEKTETPLVVG